MTTSEFWEAQQVIYDRIDKVGFSLYLSELDASELDKAKQENDFSLSCMDEGIRKMSGIHSAGSCILQDLDHAAEKLRGKVKTVYSHEGCGAAALHCKQNGIPAEKTDEEAINWSKRLAEVIGAEYAGHIKLSEMDRPAESHIARCVYITGRNFNPNLIEGLPQGFVISRDVIGAQDTLEELVIAYGIAKGDHGFGQRISEANPFHVFIIGDGSHEELELGKIENEIRSYIDAKGFHMKLDGINL